MTGRAGCNELDPYTVVAMIIEDAYEVKQEIEAEYQLILGEEGFNRLRDALKLLLAEHNW